MYIIWKAISGGTVYRYAAKATGYIFIGHLYTNHQSIIHQPHEDIQWTRKKECIQLHILILKWTKSSHCSGDFVLSWINTLDSMIIQVTSQEIHIVDSLCNSLLWLDTALLVNVHGYHLHNQWLLVSLSNCLISHTYIEVFLFLMSKMSNTLFARCWTGTDLLLISLGVYPFYFGIIPLGFTPLGVVGYFRDWLTTVQHQPKRIVRAAPPPKKQSLGNNGPNTHTSENCWSLRTPAPFLEGIKQ